MLLVLFILLYLYGSKNAKLLFLFIQVAFSLSADVPVLSIPAVGYSRTISMQSNMSVLGNSNNNLVRLVDPAIAEKSMILGRVISYRADTGEYDILDVDDSKKYILPERQVVVLDLLESQRKLSKGELVFALYPDTTSFYPAVVSHAPRRTAMGTEPSVIVQFCGDEEIDTGRYCIVLCVCVRIFTGYMYV